MAIEPGFRVLLMQFLQQLCQSLLLLGRARVLGRFAVLGTAPDIDHTDAESVVSVLHAMRTHHIDGTAIVDAAVEVYHLVITNAVGPMALVAVDAVNLLDSHLTVFRRSRTMYDDLVYSSHGSPPSLPVSCSAFMADLSSANLVWM